MLAVPAVSASRNFGFAHNDTKSTSDRGRNQSRRVIAISGPTYREGRQARRAERRDGAGVCNGARKCHEDWLYLVSQRARVPGFWLPMQPGAVSVVRAGPAPAVPLNPTGITCAGHNMSGSIKIRTVQIKLSLRPMSDREYLPGCELPHVYSRLRCDSRMRRTHPHNWRFE